MPTNEFLSVCDRHLKFSLSTFTESTALSSLKKAQEEVKECIDSMVFLLPKKDTVEEYADCMMSLIDSASRFGVTPQELVLAMRRKTIINERRTWIKNEDNTYSRKKY